MQMRWMWVVVAWASLAGCLRSSSVTASFVVNGGVSNEAGRAVPNAQVSIQGISAVQIADANGIFEMHIAPPTGHLAVTIRAAGYVPRTFYVTLKANMAGTALMATLRAVDRVNHFTLPSSSDGPLSFSIVRGDGQATLTVLPNTLVTPDGKIAVGDANVSLTYWNPVNSFRSAPGDLLTGDGNGNVMALQSFGMMDIEVEQEGQLLQIAKGKTLPLAFQMPPDFKTLLGQTGFVKPDLYYMNPNTALWEKQGTVATGEMAFANDNSAVTAQLPHLSAWNIDGLDPRVGGCVMGHAYNTCKNPLPGADIKIYFTEWEELAAFSAHTASDGSYCVNTQTHPVYTVHGADDTLAYVAAANNLDNSSMCHPSPGTPIPVACLACENNESACCRHGIDYGVPVGTTSVPDPDGGPPLPACDNAYYIYNMMHYINTPITSDECHVVCGDQPNLVVSPCHICAGSAWPNAWCYGNLAGQAFDNNCTAIPDVYIDDGDPSCPRIVTGGPPVPTDPCAGKTAVEGQVCDAKNPCCNRPDLTCLDNLCVPKTDPQ